MSQFADDAPCRHLEELWARSIPLTQAMGLRVVDHEPGCLELEAALEPNVNVHGTGFAGSVYAVAALAGWGLLYLELRRRELDAAIVIARGQMDYTLPVDGDFRALAELGEHADAFKTLRERGKARLELSASVTVAGIAKASLSAVYALKQTGVASRNQ